MIASREYRYLCPVIRYNALTKNITRLRGASLVHGPNLELTALSREERPMSDPTEPDQIAEVLDLDQGADLATILTALDRRSTAPDPARYVPIEAVRELMVDRGEQTPLMSGECAKNLVDDATTEGHATPAMRDARLGDARLGDALCRQDAGAFKGFIKTSPAPFAHPGRRKTFPADPVGGASASPEMDALCRQPGPSPDDLKD